MFKKGDKVIIYRKTRPWKHGNDDDKDRLLRAKTVVVVYSDIGSSADQVKILDPLTGVYMNIHRDCLVLANKKSIIFLED